MNVHIGLRAVALLAFVAAATIAIVKPDLIGGAAQLPSPAALAVVALHHL